MGWRIFQDIGRGLISASADNPCRSAYTQLDLLLYAKDDPFSRRLRSELQPSSAIILKIMPGMLLYTRQLSAQ